MKNIIKNRFFWYALCIISVVVIGKLSSSVLDSYAAGLFHSHYFETINEIISLIYSGDISLLTRMTISILVTVEMIYIGGKLSMKLNRICY